MKKTRAAVRDEALLQASAEATAAIWDEAPYGYFFFWRLFEAFLSQARAEGERDASLQATCATESEFLFF
ncbi:MAG: hypothetical protein FJ134_06385 [Deltaproteobacteria bacterium]|nr:hypothetical protein [Deltaproteobacteria bacterium]